MTLELVSDGASIANQSQPVDFLIEYSSARSFLISSDSGALAMPTPPSKEREDATNGSDAGTGSAPLSSLDGEFKEQARVNAPKWTKWEGQQIETSIGDMRQLSNETMISYSILNSSNQPVEILPPQIQITERTGYKEEKEGRQRHHLGPVGNSRLPIEHNPAGAGRTGRRRGCLRSAQFQGINGEAISRKSRRRTRWIVLS